MVLWWRLHTERKKLIFVCGGMQIIFHTHTHSCWIHCFIKLFELFRDNWLLLNEQIHGSRNQAYIRNDVFATSLIVKSLPMSSYVCLRAAFVQSPQPPPTFPTPSVFLCHMLSLSLCAQQHMYLWCLLVAGSLYLSLDCTRIRKCKG